IAGDLLDAETMYAAKTLLEGQGSKLLEGRQTGLAYDTSSLSAVAFNSTIAGIENADVVLLVGSNIRWEAALIATRVRKVARKGGIADVEAAAPELVLLLGADEAAADRFKGAYKVYIGHHGDAGAKMADLVLPGAAYAEKHGTYVNTEGRVQWSERALFAPGEAREDWAILRAVSELAGKKLPFDSYDQLRAAMVAEHPQLGRDGLIDLPWAPPKLP